MDEVSQVEKQKPANEGEFGPKHQVVYVVLALFFGFLGVHNFYIGRWKRGLIQLLLTICTFFMAALIVEVWALINMFAIKTDGNGRLMHPSRTAQIICSILFVIMFISQLKSCRDGFMSGYSNGMTRYRSEGLLSYVRMVQVVQVVEHVEKSAPCASLAKDTYTVDMSYDCVVNTDGTVLVSGLDDEVTDKLAKISSGTKVGKGKVLIPAMQ